MNELNVQGVNFINDEIEYIINLTSNSVGMENKQVDTKLLRQCICHYVEKIFGFINDDFDYSKVNMFLKF